jgi:hypothetical protein
MTFHESLDSDVEFRVCANRKGTSSDWTRERDFVAPCGSQYRLIDPELQHLKIISARFLTIYNSLPRAVIALTTLQY